MKKIFQIFFAVLIYANSNAANVDPKVIDKAYKANVTIETRVSVSAYDNSGKWQGTGFIHNIKDGIILTNRHVVGRSSIGNYLITFFNGQKIEAKLKYYSLWQDFAILQVDPKFIPQDAQEIAFSNKLPTQNQPVFIVGNNEGQGFSFHDGYLSNLYSINGDMPQHTYIVNLNATGGSSGSPLLDLEGNAIGINYGGGQTYNLALKGEYIKDALAAVKNKTEPINRHIGVICELYSLDKAVRHRNFPVELMLNYLKEFPDSRNNVLAIKDTIKGSPADSIIQAGDIIWAVNGQKVGSSLYEFDKSINNSTKVNLTLYRKGQKIEITINSYDVNSNKITKMVEFGGAILFASDDFFSQMSGIPLNSVAISNISTGMSMSVIPTKWIRGEKSIYRIKLNNINQNNVTNIQDLINSICNLNSNKFINIGFENFQPYYLNYDEIIISEHEKLMSDITLDNIDFNPRIFNFNPNKMEWEINESACTNHQKN